MAAKCAVYSLERAAERASSVVRHLQSIKGQHPVTSHIEGLTRAIDEISRCDALHLLLDSPYVRVSEQRCADIAEGVKWAV
jgi:hypothetical protein